MKLIVWSKVKEGQEYSILTATIAKGTNLKSGQKTELPDGDKNS